MALTLIQLFEKESDPDIRNKVKAACWKYAKTLLAKASPIDGELKQALKALVWCCDRNIYHRCVRHY